MPHYQMGPCCCSRSIYVYLIHSLSHSSREQLQTSFSILIHPTPPRSSSLQLLTLPPIYQKNRNDKKNNSQKLASPHLTTLLHLCPRILSSFLSSCHCVQTVLLSNVPCTLDHMTSCLFKARVPAILSLVWHHQFPLSTE